MRAWSFEVGAALSRRCVRFVAFSLGALAGGIFAGAAGAASGSAGDKPAYPTTEFADGATTASVTDRGVTATVTLERRKEIDPDVDVPVLRVTVDGKTVAEAVGVDSGLDEPDAEASIVEMDQSNDTPEVYFNSYSGGAHCCNTVMVVEKVGNTWQVVPVGDFDGDGDFLDDADGDGVAEISTVDNRFLYEFDCYACSAAPLAIYAIKAGTVKDVSREPRFLAAHRDWLKHIEETLEPEDRWTSRGFLAGWLGEKIILGEGVAAWDQLNKHWDAASDPGEDVCPDGSDPGQCEAKDVTQMKFPATAPGFPDRQRLHVLARQATR